MSGITGKTRLALSARFVLGFDVRIAPSMLARNYEASSGPKHSYAERILCPLVLDPQVWPSIFDQDEAVQNVSGKAIRNGYNLLFDLKGDAFVRSGIENEMSAAVAFDIDATTYQSLRITFGEGWNKLGGTSQDLLEANWVLMGFDVIDPRTQLSGLFGFDFSPQEQARIENATRTAISVFGLLTQLENARAVSTLLDSLIPEHSPFCPCGVWLAVK